MRLPVEPDDRPAAEFLVELAELGFDTHHSSVEYDTSDRYEVALTAARAAGGRFRHVVKIAEPSWDSDRFDPGRFLARVDAECERLGTEHIDTVQWLVRTPDPADVDATSAVLERDRDAIVQTFRTLIESGRIGEVFGFPYTRPMAEKLIDDRAGDALVDGLTLYLNPEERHWHDLASTVPTIAIRPFAGGAVPADGRRSALLDVLSTGGVRSAMVSISSRRHAAEILRWIEGGDEVV